MVTELKKYLKLYWKLIKFSAAMEMEYRFSFILEIIVEIAFFAVTLFSIRVMFWNVTEVAGWNYYELMTLYGMNMIFSELVLGLFFIHNLRNLPSKIAKGDLDLVLTKPINSQFAVSMWRPYFAMFPSIVTGVIVAHIGFAKINIDFNWLNLIPFTVIFLSGIVIAYSIGMITTTLSIWLVNSQPLPMLAQQFIFIAKHPYDIYSAGWKIIFTTLLPIAFMVSMPTSVLFGKYELWWIPASIIAAAAFLFASNKFWSFALKKYSSASS